MAVASCRDGAEALALRPGLRGRRVPPATAAREIRQSGTEREIPGAAGLTHDELRGITSTSNNAVASLGKPYKWLHSYVAGDKVYCFHQAEDAEVIREHARAGGFPANLVAEVASVFDSTGPRDFPR
jgi:Protein of unknown function (DUF4242)